MGARSWPKFALACFLAWASAPARAISYDVSSVASNWIATHRPHSHFGLGQRPRLPRYRRRRQPVRASRSRLFVPARRNQLHPGARQHQRPDRSSTTPTAPTAPHAAGQSAHVPQSVAEHEPQQFACRSTARTSTKTLPARSRTRRSARRRTASSSSPGTTFRRGAKAERRIAAPERRTTCRSSCTKVATSTSFTAIPTTSANPATRRWDPRRSAGRSIPTTTRWCAAACLPTTRAYRFTLARPYVEYRMDDALVERHRRRSCRLERQRTKRFARRRTGAEPLVVQTIASGKICRAMDVPDNGGNAQIDAVNSSVVDPNSVGSPARSHSGGARAGAGTARRTTCSTQRPGEQIVLPRQTQQQPAALRDDRQRIDTGDACRRNRQQSVAGQYLEAHRGDMATRRRNSNARPSTSISTVHSSPPQPAPQTGS